MQLAATLFGRRYQFRDIKDLLAKANEEKSGDQLAGVAAESAAERMAARFVLSEVTLETLRQNPAVPYEEDEVTRVIDDAVNEAVFAEIKGMQVGELREWLLADTTTGDMIKRLSNGLTSEMVAAVTKLMSNLDLMLAASKIRV
ncbi:MAG: ethanolamine ammonia-lyase subunit EutB, partial [Nocardioidaceae bacterium]